MSVLIVADSDTRWKWAHLIARQVVTPAGRLDGALVDGPSLPSQRQLAEMRAEVNSLRVASLDDLADAHTYDGYDAVVAGATGGVIFAVIQTVAALDPRTRPVTVTGYVGLVYEKELEGLQWRIGADVICVNSARNAKRFERYCADLGVDPGVLVRTGLPSVPERVPVSRRPVQALTFAVQPDVPRTKEERIYALERLVEYAEAHPDRRVIMKLRARPGEVTMHPEPFHYEKLHRRSRLPSPPNLEFAYGYMRDVLERVDLCLTVSSTAAMEAISLGIPTGILTDFGVRESLGNHVFLDSGCLISFDELLAGTIPEPDPDWLADNGLGDDDRLSNVSERVEQLVKQRDADPEGLPPQPAWLRPDRTTHLLAAHADKYGAGGGGGGPRWPRRIVRRLLKGPARRAYRRLDTWTRG